MASKAEYRLELYKRWMSDPVDPELNEWWSGLNTTAQDSLSELHRREKVFERDEVESIEIDQRKKSLVDEILNQDYINADKFKTKIPRQTGIDAPDDYGLIKYHSDGGREVVNDPKSLNLLMMDEVRPAGINPFSPEMEKWSEDLRKKGELERQGYKLYNVSKGYVVDPPKKEKSVLDIVREPHVNQWQAWVNTWSKSDKSRERVDLLKNIGHDPEENLRKIAQLNAELKGIPTSEAYARFNQTDNWGDAFKELGMNPIEILGIGITESMLQFFPAFVSNAIRMGGTMGASGAVVGGIPGAIAGTGYGLITAGGMTSFNMEYTGKIFEALEERGVDITNANQLVDAWQNEELMKEVEGLAIKKGVPIAIFDLVSGGIAGRLAGSFKSKAVGGAVEMGAQMGLGGGGELTGQVASGEEISPSAILMEAFAEPGQAMPMGAYNMATQQVEAVNQSKFNKTAVGQEILKARAEGAFDEATIDMAEKLVKQDAEAFENKSVLQFIDEVKVITDAELQERGIDPTKFKEGEGIDPDTSNLRALGSTEVENGQVIVKLYKGARPQDVIEEFYGNHFRRLRPEDKSNWQNYYQEYKDSGGLLTEQEYFEKQGQMFYFGYNLSTDSKIIKVFRKIKFLMDDMFSKAGLDPSIRKMYEDAGFGRFRDVDVEDGDVSYSVAPIWYSKSVQAVDKINASSVKARGLRNFFRRQGVSNEEMQAVKIGELLSGYKPTDSIPVSEIKRHIEKNEVQLVDWGTIEEVYERQKQEQDEAIAKLDSPRELTEEEWEDFYENEAEYEYPEEQRYDIVQYGDSWRDLDMYGDQTPGYETENEALQAVQEEIDYRMGEDWYEIEQGHHDWLSIEERETDDLDNYPLGIKYVLVEGDYDPTPIMTEQPLGFRAPQIPEDTRKVISESANRDDWNLREDWEEYARPAYEEDMYVEEFTWTDEDAEPEIVNMPDQPPRRKPIERIRPRWGTGSQVQPGGKDYQELIIKLDKQGKRIYSSGHFDVDNPLVHTRFNTREDKDGKKVLFVEEIQSDWHQEGAKSGYKSDKPAFKRKDWDGHEVWEGQNTFKDLSIDYIMDSEDGNMKYYLYRHGTEIGSFRTKEQAIQHAENQYSGKTPDAPYKDFNWISLAGKRLLKYAVDNNFDKIAWVTGKQQVDRNNLRQYISRLAYKYNKATEGAPQRYQVIAYSTSGRRVVFDRVLERNELQQFVGKSISDRIIEDKGDEVAPGGDLEGFKVLSGLDLEIGGENREKLYDVEIANRMKKLAGNLGTTQIETAFDENRDAIVVDHQSIDITDKVKDKYSKPMPSFSLVPEDEANAKNFNKKKWSFPKIGEGDFIIPISTRLKRISPVLKKALRDFEFAKIKYSRDDRKRIKPFLDKFVELSKENKKAFDLMDYYLKNAMADQAYTLALENNMDEEFIALRDYLDEMYERAKDVGIDMGFIDSYFPRRVEDFDGLMNHFEREDQGVIQKALDKEKERLGVEVLDDDDKSRVINRLITSSKSLGKKSSHIKRRNQKILIDGEINNFYQDSPSTLLNYIDSMNEMIAETEFFGKGENRSKSIGKYVAKLVDEGKIKPAQQEEVLKLFRSRFGFKGTGKRMGAIKNVGYMMTMGSPTSAITQIGDMAWSLYKGGMINTGKEFVKAVGAEFGMDTGQITPEDLGTEKIAQELESTRGTAKLLDSIFWATQLQRMDRLGKTTLVNSAIRRFEQRAKKGDPKLKPELEAVYGEETAQLIEDLKSGERTENVEMLAFNTLLDFQPVSLSEMPVKYLDSPNGRILYQLKTFTIKQFDVFRNEAFDKIKAGKTKEGMQNLVKLAVTFGLANATGDMLKDLLMGRKINGDDYFWTGVWRLMGVSRYHVWKTKDRGIGTGLLNVLTPAQFGIADQLWVDAIKVGGSDDPAQSLKEMRSWTFVPLLGKTGFWWWGGGKKKITMQEIDRYRDKQKEGKVLTRAEVEALSSEASTALEQGWITYKQWKNIVLKGK